MADMGVVRTGTTDFGTGTCFDHGSPQSVTVTFTTGSSTFKADGGFFVVRVGDTGIASCGHTTVALTGSSLVTADGLGLHRVGDTGRVGSSGTYTVIQASTAIKAF